MLTGLAEEQAGLFTAAQARMIGVRRSQLLDLVGRHTIERVRHGVYLISGAPVDQWTRIRAAWLALSPERSAADRLAGDDPDAVVTGRSAAHLLDLGDVEADRIEFTATDRRRASDPDVVIRRGRLARSDWTVRAGLPVTTPGKTVAMLAADGLDLGHLAGVTRDAMLRYDVPAAILAAALDGSARRYSYRTGEELADHLLRLAGAPRSAVDLAAAVLPQVRPLPLPGPAKADRG
jgi:hypothetical protein